MNPNKALWEKGDFTQIAAFVRQSGEKLAQSLVVTPQMKALVETNVLDRFGQAGVPKDRISMGKDTWWFVSEDRGPREFIESFRRFYGPTMNAFEAAQKNGKVDELLGQLVDLAATQNTAAGGTSIPATFLRVTVRR